MLLLKVVGALSALSLIILIVFVSVFGISNKKTGSDLSIVISAGRELAEGAADEVGRVITGVVQGKVK